MKIIASFVFNPFTHDSRVQKEAISLNKAGYKVVVLAHGYKNLPQEDKIDNIKIKRFSYLDRNATRGKFKKLKIYLSYVYQAVHYSKRFNILHCNDLNTLPIAFIIKQFFNRKIKIVYDAHEYETEINGLNGIKKTLSKYLEKFLIRYADRVITVSDSIADEYVKLYGVQKPALVLNTPPYQEIEKKDIFREKFNISKEKTVFLYQGGLSIGRGIELLLDTFTQVNQQSVIVFMGYGPLSNLVYEYANKYPNIYYHEAVSPDVLLLYTSSADFGILFYENNCLNHYYCSPNKMFEYLMAEIPVIVSNLHEMKKIVNEYKVGVVAEDNSVEGLKHAIENAQMQNQKEMLKNIKNINKIYNWEVQEKILLKTYKEISS